MGIFRGVGGTGNSTDDGILDAVSAQAVIATDKATEAATSAANAASSATNATTKASQASTSATSAVSSASSAATSATNASTSASSASTSASNASSSATTATTKASEAATSASTATTKASEASTSATNAASSATSATSSASTATTKAGEASTSATNAASSATSATSSASTATTKASEASTSAASAASSYDSFDDRYLGAKSSAPSADNDGDSLVTGALYFDTSSNAMKVYSGSAWLDAYASLSGALIATNNLSDLNNAGTARTNLGLGTAATTASSAYATAAQGTTADNALPKSGGAMTGAITTNSTFDGRDVSADGTKLDTIATNADVTNTTSVTAAGALMDSEVTNLAQVKAFSSSDYATAAQGTKADTAHGWGNHASQSYATQSYVNTQVSNLVDSAPSTLDTLNELASALGDDANFSTTVTNSIATKLPLAGGSLTGNLSTNSKISLSSAHTKQKIEVYGGGDEWIGTSASTLELSGTNINLNGGQGTGTANLKMGGTTVIDSSRNLTNINDATADQFFSTNNGNGLNYKVGDDAWIGDVNSANAIRITGVQNAQKGYIIFGNANTTALGRDNTGALTYGGNTLWHSGNDGSGSGLDADTLDGVQASSFLRSDEDDQVVSYTSNIRFYSNSAMESTTGNDASLEVFQPTAGSDAFMAFHISGDYAGYFGIDGSDNQFKVGGWSFGANKYKVWHQGNDGSGSGLDADTLDGVQGSSYLRSDTGDTFSGHLKVTGAGSYASGIDSVSNGSLVLTQGKYIYSEHNNNYLRNIIGHQTDGRIGIGQSGTALITGIDLKAGASGHIKVHSRVTSGNADLELRRNDSSYSFKLAQDGSDINIRHKANSYNAGFQTRHWYGNTMLSNSGDTGTVYGVLISSSNLYPAKSGVSSFYRDNAMDLGHSSSRWDDIYATNGTIQTSDEREKQDIEALSEAEQRVAVAAKGLLRKFRWKDKVAAKGDDARIHFGIIAQDLEAAFIAEGLDPSKYAMFIKTEWWVGDKVYPAVEEETDEEGNVITEAVEEATDPEHHYDNQADAPADAVYNYRMGIRYSELLAFIISAI